MSFIISQIQQLMTSLPEIIRDINSQHPDWIDRLVLIGYDSDSKNFNSRIHDNN